jgi:acetyltransferase
MWHVSPALFRNAPVPAAERVRAAQIYPAQLAETWLLPDGTSVTIRPMRPQDAAMELAFLNGLSMQTRYQRVLSTRKLLPGELRRLTCIDYRRDMALVATVEVDGATVQIGVARYVRGADGQSAEFAIVIADAWQHRGLGEKLMTKLIDIASRHQLDSLTGMALSTNTRMLALARKLGFGIRLDPQDATVAQLRRLLEAAPTGQAPAFDA